MFRLIRDFWDILSAAELEAAELIRLHGACAYRIAIADAQGAADRGDHDRARYLTRVAAAVAADDPSYLLHH